MSPTAWGWLVLGFPLAGFFVNAFGWRVMRGRTAGWIATVAIGLAFVCAIAATVSLLGHTETTARSRRRCGHTPRRQGSTSRSGSSSTRCRRS